MRNLTYYVGATLDGFIAAPDGDHQFLMPYVGGDFLAHLCTEFPETVPTPGRAAMGIADAPNKRFDTVLMGRGTYEPGLAVGLTGPYAHLRQIVFSRGLTESPDPAVEVTAADPLELVRELKRQDGLGIWLCGGGELAGRLLPEIDELIVKQYPLAIGAGVPLFRAAFAPHAFGLAGSRTFPNGVSVLTYRRTGAATDGPATG
ncbi:dihydrofolate reductase family protein [Kitasatospora sp. NPDC056327]|uniref:dihydrofolate reductase family protein n=1 Tax=Kitasatospora sp. NPDC056327 TaxID=3345785 RepID=UPI0035DC95BC